MDFTLTLVLVSSISVIAVFFKLYYATLHEKIQRSPPYPPGPKPLPLLGNLLDIPDISPWITFAEWRKSYGGLIYVYLPGCFGHTFIVNSEVIAVELLEKKAAIYSDRPTTFIEERSGADVNLGVIPYTERWRKYRKTFHQALRPSAMPYFRPVQRRLVNVLLSDLLNTPAGFLEHLLTLSQSIVFSGMYGLEGSSQDLPVQLAQAAAHVFEELFAPRSLVIPKLFPFMRHLPAWMPGCQFQTYLKETRQTIEEMKTVPFDLAIKRMEIGIPSLVAELVGKNQHDPHEIERIKDMAATTYIGSVETTTATISTFFLAMTLNPSVQAKAQEEIDRVIGSSRLPSFDDRQSLPYIEAVYREVLRWNPAVPIGAPHKSTESNVYNGYYIPKGATIIANIWGMNRDESVYDEPNEFRPERFLTGSPNAPFTGINDILAYGFGRRVCVGRHMADALIWLTIASVLATFRITKDQDDQGNDVEVPGHMSTQFFSRPEPFRCSIKPRSAQAEMLAKVTASPNF